MSNPLYGSNSYDSMVGWKKNMSPLKDLGTLGDNITLNAYDMLNNLGITCDPTAARNATTPTAAELIAAIADKSSSEKCMKGDTCEFLLINGGTAGVDESITLVAGSNVTLAGNVQVENSDTTHDAFSVGSAVFLIHVTDPSGSGAVTIVRKS